MVNKDEERKRNFFEMEKEMREFFTMTTDTLEGLEDEEEKKQFLESIEDELKQFKKDEGMMVDVLGLTLSKVETEADRIGVIIKTLSQRKKILTNRSDRIKDFFFSSIQHFGKTKLEGEVYIARIKHNASVVISDEDEIPEKYKTKVLDIKISKKLISDDLKLKKEIPGAKFTFEDSVTIKAR